MEKLDGYTLMYLLKNTVGISIEELIQYEYLDYTSPTTVNRYLNKEKHPKFPTSLTIEKVQRTFSHLQHTHFRDNTDGFVNTVLGILEHDLAAPAAAHVLRMLYETKREELGETAACRILIDDLYIKCRTGYTGDTAAGDSHHARTGPEDPDRKYDGKTEKAAENKNPGHESDGRQLSEKDFVVTLKSLKYMEEGEAGLSGLKIMQSWIPGLTDKKEQYTSLEAFILEHAGKGMLPHSVVFAEPGAGKTYSVFAAFQGLLSTPVMYCGKELIPVFVSSLLISINNSSIMGYVSRVFFGGGVQAAEKACRGESDVHYVLLIDAVNESLARDELLEEIMRLSYPLNRNITLIVSSNNTDEENTLHNAGFVSLYLKQLDPDTVDQNVDADSLSSGMKALLRKPFYLKKYLSYRGEGSEDDEYSIIDSYIDHCKTNGKIVNIHGYRDWIRLLDEQLPLLCYRCAIRKQMYISLSDEAEEEFSVLQNEENTWRLVQIGVLKKYGDAVYFEHENYQSFFAAKYLYRRCLEMCSNPEAPRDLKISLLRKTVRLLQHAPANVCAILGPKLYNEHILEKLLAYGTLVNDRVFYQVLLNLFSYATTCLEGLDFRGADLWLANFGKFDRIRNCDFSGADLNPETLWLHHARISYTAANSGRIHGDLIFLSGPEGFEVYNRRDDRQMFIRFVQKGLPSAWEVTDKALLLAAGGICYRVEMDEIAGYLHSNTFAPGEDLVLTEQYIDDKNEAAEIRKTAGVTVNSRGDELSYRAGKELFVRMSGRPIMLKLSDICHFATFLDDGTVFIDSDGVYFIMTLEGVLVWRRMIRPVVPSLLSLEGDGAIVQMRIPGIETPKLFRYSFKTRKMTYVSPEGGFADTADDTGEDVPQASLIITDSSGRKHCVFGGAIEFTGSVLDKATIVSRPIEEDERQILMQFGAL